MRRAARHQSLLRQSHLTPGQMCALMCRAAWHQSSWCQSHLNPDQMCALMCRAAWHQSWLAGLRAFASWAALAALQAVLWVLRPALVLALRSSVRSRAFWQRGLRSSW